MSVSSAEMLQRFVEIPSHTGSEAAFVDHLHGFMRDQFTPDHLELQEVAPGRSNLIMVNGKPEIMLTSHMDTVPTSIVLRTEGGRLYGTGACDAKGQIAAQLGAIHMARDSGLEDFGCFFVVGEEIDSLGARNVVEHPLVRGKYVLNGEPTGNAFVKRSKGVVEAAARTEGTEAHSSLTPLDSATHKLIAGMHRLLEKPPLDTTVNIGLLRGGVAPNVSASHAEGAINLRIAQRSEAVIEAVKKLLGHDISMEVLDVIEPFDFYVPANHADAAITVNYCSDASYYATNFEHVMMFGPGDIRYAHSQKEHVELSQVEDASRVMGHLLLAVNATEREV
ncbi:MAG TPA: M20/M25/M40 family metallo-hydrolase [Candidatus Saccharimonadales bacterium]